jgi:hypothetical protein
MSTQNKELELMQGSIERTITVDVMTRKVATAENGAKTEVGVPKKVFVRPLPMRRWVQALSYMTAVLGNLPSTSLDLSDPMKMSIWIIHVLGKIPDEIFGLLELATDEPAEFFDTIDLDDGVNVVMAVVKVNKDFFVQKVLPMLSEVAPSLKETVESTLGQTQ